MSSESEPTILCPDRQMNSSKIYTLPCPITDNPSWSAGLAPFIGISFPDNQNSDCQIRSTPYDREEVWICIVWCGLPHSV